MFVAMVQKYLGVCHSGVTTGKEWSCIRPVSETAFQVCFMSLVRWSWVI